MKNEIRLFKLITGETIIATVGDHDEEMFELVRPLAIGTYQPEDGYLATYYYHWMPMSGDIAFQVPFTTIVTIGTPNVDGIKKYKFHIGKEIASEKEYKEMNGIDITEGAEGDEDEQTELDTVLDLFEPDKDTNYN